MRRARPRGGALPAPRNYYPNFQELNQPRVIGQNAVPSDFYTARLSNVVDVGQRLVAFIKQYLAVPNSVAGRANATYQDYINDFLAYGLGTLAFEFGINDQAPNEFFRYIPTFVVYDMLNIRGMNQPTKENREQSLKLANMIRSVLPISDPDNFSKWEEFYRDFKNGKYSGGKSTWRARKAQDTPYDPVDPIFDFTQEPRLKIKGLDKSDMAIGDSLFMLDAMPPTNARLTNGRTNLFRGGHSRRTARSSRRRR